MSGYEYKVLPAPRKGEKAKGIKTPEARFAHAVEGLINRLAAEGWEYQRADFLPSDERSGLTSTTTQWRNILVFRRARAGATFQMRPLAEPEPAPAPAMPGSAMLEPDKPRSDPDIERERMDALQKVGAEGGMHGAMPRDPGLPREGG